MAMLDKHILMVAFGYPVWMHQYVKGTSKNLAPAAFFGWVRCCFHLLSSDHTSLLLSRILRSSILSSSRLVQQKNEAVCHPFEVLRTTLNALFRQGFSGR